MSEIHKPTFITFTGVDDHTDVDGMRALSDRYPIEWGVLFSPTRQGVDYRYPGADALRRVYQTQLRLAGHLCGEHARNVVAWQWPDVPAIFSRFSRMQINHAAPDVDAIEHFQDQTGVRCIAQTHGPEFPGFEKIHWLFDVSGGRGKEPEALPPYPGRKVGYAGGIGPDNVRSVIARINASGPYWIDMESGVRTNNWFDLSLCRKVCEAVYG